MANKKINELSTRTPSLTDLILVGDPTSGYSYKCTVTALATIIETDIADAYVTLDTAQTISGAKTFSNNLTLTSVTNAATTQTKFLTLNGSNVVNYRTGSQVLADIGGQGAITLTTTGTSGAATLVGNTLNIPNYAPDLSGYVPYTGATTNVVLGMNNINANNLNVQPTGFGLLASLTRDITGSGYGILLLKNGANGYLQPSVMGVDRTWTLPNASGTVALTSDLSSYVPTSRTLTINGTSYDLSANRTWSVGTVTSVGLSTGTTGTDISVSGSPITSSGTITLNIPTASATNRGALSSTDWSTFNNKQNAITLTTSGTSGAATLVGSTLNIPQYQAVLSNPVTGTGTTNYIPKFTSSSAIGNSILYVDGTTLGVNTSAPYLGASAEFRQQSVYDGIYVSESASSRKAISMYHTGSVGTIDVTYLGGGGSYTPLSFVTGGSERMRLDASGNLGLGTTAPYQAKLDVQGVGGTGSVANIAATNSNLDQLLIGSINRTSSPAFFSLPNGSAFVGAIGNGVNNTLGIGTFGAAPLIFGTTNTERMRLDASGNLGLGTSSPAVKLDIAQSSSGSTVELLRLQNTGVGANTSARLNFYAASTNYGSITGGYGSSSPELIFDINSANGIFRWRNNTTEQMRLDASGNLGLGVTPSAWGSNAKALQFSGGSLWNFTSSYLFLSQNAYFDNTNQIYVNSAPASDYYQYNGQHIWRNAPSGTAGNAISFTQAMTLFSTGNLAVGGTSDNGNRLQVNGNVSITGQGVFSSYITATTLNASTGTINLNAEYLSGNDATVHFKQGGYHDWYIKTPAGNNPLQFSVDGGSALMAITSGGNVGIGTTSPAYPLQVAGIGKFEVQSGATNNTAPTALIVANKTTGAHTSSLGSSLQFEFTNSGGAYSGGLISSVGGADPFTADLRFSARNYGYVEAMRITSAGNVGIGTTSPNEKLTIYSTGTAGTSYWGASGSSATELYVGQGSDATAYVFQRASTSLIFGTNNSERMRITSGGNVGIGTTSPSEKLDLQGTMNMNGASGTYASIQYNGTTRGYYGTANAVISGGATTDFGISATSNLVFGTGGSYTERMRITSGGELLINTTSDAGDYKLQVNGNIYANGVIRSDNAYVQIVNSSNPSLYLSNNTIQWQIYNNSSNELVFKDGTSDLFKLTYSTGNATFGGSIKTAAPSGGTAKPIKFGEIVTLGGSNTQGVRVEIDGTVYYLVTGYLP